MPGNAQEVIETFWRIQNDRDYTKLVELFADDAVLEDPIWGTMNGKKEIADFMAKMNEETKKAQMHFDAVEICGDDTTAWCQWEAVTPAGRRQGCGLYKVQDGKMTYYKDYMNPAEAG